jgi:hypothetical protein
MSTLNLYPDQNENTTNQIIQIKNSSNKQSKEHLAFNKLTKRIEGVQKKIDSETKKLEELLALYHKEVFPRVLELGNAIYFMKSVKRLVFPKSKTKNWMKL